jgi:hypothetical protein
MTVGANRKSKMLLALMALAIVGALFVVLAVAKPTLAQTSDQELRVTKPGSGTSGPLSAAQKQAISQQGYLVPDQGAYDKAKAEAANYLSLYQVTRNTDGTMNLGTARNVTVPTYDVPANAPQPGTTNRLDALDARNTQAVSAIDPSRGTSGATAIWTQHTVFGGSGAVVRWYEISPAAPSLFQSGTVAGASGRYIFNGAISPDRKVRSTATKFGNSMVLGFNSSSTTQRPDIRTVSKIGANPVSGQVLIKSSPASLNDFTCTSNLCRWGDYAAASPDPATPLTATHGRVWLTNQWVANSGSNSAAGWGSWNWATMP